MSQLRGVNQEFAFLLTPNLWSRSVLYKEQGGNEETGMGPLRTEDDSTKISTYMSRRNPERERSAGRPRRSGEKHLQV